MKIVVKNTKITAYAIVGIIEGSIDIDSSIVPSNFFDEWFPEKFLYINGEIIKNPDFVPPEPEPPEPSLEEQITELKEQNQMLTDCILEMSEIVYGE